MVDREITTTEILEFFQQHMVMKDDLARLATKEDLLATKSDVLESVDRFAKLHEVLDQELVAMRSKYDRLEERLKAVEGKLGLAY
jgi:hypothetical protein